MRFMVAKERKHTTVSTPPCRYIQQLGGATVAGSSVEFSILSSRGQRWQENETNIGRVAFPHNPSPPPAGKEICEEILIVFFFFTSCISILSHIPTFQHPTFTPRQYIPQGRLPLLLRLSFLHNIITFWVTATAPNNEVTRRTRPSLHFSKSNLLNLIL